MCRHIGFAETIGQAPARISRKYNVPDAPASLTECPALPLETGYKTRKFEKHKKGVESEVYMLQCKMEKYLENS